MASQYYEVQFQAVARKSDGNQLSSFTLLTAQWLPEMIASVPFEPDNALGWMEQKVREAFVIDARQGVRI